MTGTQVLATEGAATLLGQPSETLLFQTQGRAVFSCAPCIGPVVRH